MKEFAAIVLALFAYDGIKWVLRKIQDSRNLRKWRGVT